MAGAMPAGLYVQPCRRAPWVVCIARCGMTEVENAGHAIDEPAYSTASGSAPLAIVLPYPPFTRASV
jgi:hypothetical protein